MTDNIEDTLVECGQLVGRLADIFEDPDVIILRGKIDRAIAERRLEKGLTDKAHGEKGLAGE